MKANNAKLTEPLGPELAPEIGVVEGAPGTGCTAVMDVAPVFGFAVCAEAGSVSEGVVQESAPSDVVGAALELHARGYSIVPLHPRSKKPAIKGWNLARLTADELEQKLKVDSNIGIVLGELSGGLVDVDLDNDRAVVAARRLLPGTAMRHGRPGKPDSHYWYRVPTSVKTSKFEAGGMIVELRGDGAVTAVPPSVHPLGEVYEWVERGEPATVLAEVLRTKVERVAAAVVLAEGWVEGKRHEMALALAGTLAQSSWSEEETTALVAAIAEAAEDPEVDNRCQAVADTFARFIKSETITGWHTLAGLLRNSSAALVRKWLGIRPGVASQKEAPYFERDGCLYMRKSGNDGSGEAQLTNFTARITREVYVTDRDEQQRSKCLDLTVTHMGKSYALDVPADAFNSLRWVETELPCGAFANPYVGRSHTPIAIKVLSGEVPSIQGIAHTGWLKHDGGYVYVHADGVIGGTNDGTIKPIFDSGMMRFALPGEVDGGQQEHVKSVLSLTKLGPPEVMYPLVAGAFRAVLGRLNHGMWLVGQTGIYKSEVASLIQRFFGAGMDASNLPGSWSSTDNALEQQAYRLKDSLFVVDDWKVSPQTREAMERKADRLFRGLGNNQGRGRLRADLTSRPTWYPRSLVLSTGEQAPEGASLLARLFVISLKAGDIASGDLTECQKAASRGEYAAVMRDFIEWLAPGYEEVQEHLAEAEAHADTEVQGLHARTPRMAASLIFAYGQFLVYAQGIRAISEQERADEFEAARKAIRAAALQQASYVVDTDPVKRYLDVIRSLLSSGKAHVTWKGDTKPDDISAWGWRKDNYDSWKPQGAQIGWVSDGDLFLDPHATYQLAQPLMGQSAGNMGSVHRALRDRGVLRSTDTARKTLTVRKRIDGVNQNVIHLSVSAVTGDPESAPAKHEGTAAAKGTASVDVQLGAYDPSFPPEDDGYPEPLDCDPEEAALLARVMQRLADEGYWKRMMEDPSAVSWEGQAQAETLRR